MRARMLAIGVVLGTVLLAAPARAELALGLGASGDFGVANAQVQLPSSWGLQGVLGYRLKASVVEFTPELELSFARSTAASSLRQVDWSFQATGGARLGFAIGRLVPAVYAHVGLGSVQLAASTPVSINKVGPYFEAGAALGVRLSDDVSLGVQAGYGAVSLADVEADLKSVSINRFRVGLHLMFYL